MFLSILGGSSNLAQRALAAKDIFLRVSSLTILFFIFWIVSGECVLPVAAIDFFMRVSSVTILLRSFSL